MNKRSSVEASTAAPKINIARTYLQLQRLRQLGQKAESLRVPMTRINPKRRRERAFESSTVRS
jgi:hypothetical protein